MLAEYDDIRRRIPEEPKWFDENGVPRYDDFHPSLSPNVYADEVVLFEIACQNCDHRFLVERSQSRRRYDAALPLAEQVRLQALRYGDPPCFGADCPSGATLTAINLRTIQFWSRRAGNLEWSRIPELEGIELEGESCKGCGRFHELCECEPPDDDEADDGE